MKTQNGNDESVPHIEILTRWAKAVLGEQNFPIEVTIKIDKNGLTDIERKIDYRKVRGRFIKLLSSKFSEITNVIPTMSMNSSTFNQRWTKPMEAMLAQALFVGGVNYRSLKPKKRYTKLHAYVFVVLLREVYEAHVEAGLVISSPQSIEKLAISIASQGNHYQRASRTFAAMKDIQN